MKEMFNISGIVSLMILLNGCGNGGGVLGEATSSDSTNTNSASSVIPIVIKDTLKIIDNFNIQEQNSLQNTIKLIISQSNYNILDIYDKSIISNLLYIQQEKILSQELFNTFQSSNELIKNIYNAELTHNNVIDIFVKEINTSHIKITDEGLSTFYNDIDKTTTDLILILKSLALIEEKSILDLMRIEAKTTISDENNNIKEFNDVKKLYTALLNTSKKHLELLVELIKSNNGTYTAQLLDSNLYNSIIDNTIPAIITNVNFNIYSYVDDFNVTSLSLTNLNSTNPEYNLNTIDSASLEYIGQLKGVSNNTFTYFSNLLSNSTYLNNNDSLNIKKLSLNISNGEKTHLNTVTEMLDIYKKTSSSYEGLSNFEKTITKSPTKIDSGDELLESLKSMGLMEERNICDLNKYLLSNSISSEELKELYSKLEIASVNHLKIIVNTIFNSQEIVYSPQLLNISNCGVEYSSKITSAIPVDSEKIDIYFYVDDNNISEVSVAEKLIGGDALDSTIGEKESLLYMKQLMNLQKELTNNINNNPDEVNPIITAIVKSQDSYIKSMNDTLAIYDITSDNTVNNSSLITFKDFINNKVPSTNIEKLKVLALIQERVILDLRDHKVNKVSSNKDIYNIYDALFKSAENNLVVISNILVSESEPQYACQLLEETICTSNEKTYVPSASKLYPIWKGTTK